VHHVADPSLVLGGASGGTGGGSTSNGGNGAVGSSTDSGGGGGGTIHSGSNGGNGGQPGGGAAGGGGGIGVGGTGGNGLVILSAIGSSTSATGTTLQDLNYTYDKVGNITQIKSLASSTASTTVHYTYDTLNRLTNAYTNAGPGITSIPHNYWTMNGTSSDSVGRPHRRRYGDELLNDYRCPPSRRSVQRKQQD
jgi:hypothetical protein